MGYGNLLRPSDQQLSDERDPATSSAPNLTPGRKRNLTTLLSLLALALILASAISAILVVGLRARASDGYPNHRKPTQAISRTCSKTLYPALCIESLLNFPGSMVASEQDLVHISFNMTLQHFSKALYQSTSISFIDMEPIVRSAFDDCIELLDDSVDALSRSLSAVVPGGVEGGASSLASESDVVTWLSAALTNHDTCEEGFEAASGGGGSVKEKMAAQLKDLAELVSNCLAIYSPASVDGGDFDGVPIGNKRKRRLMMTEEEEEEGPGGVGGMQYPAWLGRRERELMDTPAAAIQADIVVSKDGGNGTYKTLSEAIKNAPEYSDRRTIIYVRAGR